tara:strand:- start:22136 stop:22294 length:159 start_codon:yes stop_codon:yes gene_type:complete
MIYVQARYYLASFIMHRLLWAMPKKYRLIVAVWAMDVVAKTILWKLKSGHKY